jgi:hypothetical protein
VIQPCSSQVGFTLLKCCGDRTMLIPSRVSHYSIVVMIQPCSSQVGFTLLKCCGDRTMLIPSRVLHKCSQNW